MVAFRFQAYIAAWFLFLLLLVSAFDLEDNINTCLAPSLFLSLYAIFLPQGNLNK